MRKAASFSLNETTREQLQAALQRIERRWGPRAIAPAGAGAMTASGISTGLSPLDRLLHPRGIPLHAITRLSGSTTCGKLTVAYQILAQGQRVPDGNSLQPQARPVALLDLGRSTDPDYLVRCGVAVDRLLLVRPNSVHDTGRVLLDLVRYRLASAGGAFPVILVDSLPDLLVDPSAARAFEQMLPQVNLALKAAPIAVILLDEPQPPWLSPLPNWINRAALHYEALHIELAREVWLQVEDELVGYRAQARICKRRGAGTGQSVSITIEFVRDRSVNL